MLVVPLYIPSVSVKWIVTKNEDTQKEKKKEVVQKKWRGHCIYTVSAVSIEIGQIDFFLYLKLISQKSNGELDYYCYLLFECIFDLVQCCQEIEVALFFWLCFHPITVTIEIELTKLAHSGNRASEMNMVF